MMLLQIDAVITELLKYGLPGIMIVITVYAVYTVYNKNMAIVERTLKMYEDERENTREITEEYREYIKSVVKDISVMSERNALQLDHSTEIITKCTQVTSKLLDYIHTHMNCKYNNDAALKINNL